MGEESVVIPTVGHVVASWRVVPPLRSLYDPERVAPPPEPPPQASRMTIPKRILVALSAAGSFRDLSN